MIKYCRIPGDGRKRNPEHLHHGLDKGINQKHHPAIPIDFVFYLFHEPIPFLFEVAA